ncbi:MAG: hypothetical protein MHM6MM_000913 [Cercozoa sp. M6MM]
MSQSNDKNAMVLHELEKRVSLLERALCETDKLELTLEASGASLSSLLWQVTEEAPLANSIAVRKTAAEFDTLAPVLRLHEECDARRVFQERTNNLKKGEKFGEQLLKQSEDLELVIQLAAALDEEKVSDLLVSEQRLSRLEEQVRRKTQLALQQDAQIRSLLQQYVCLVEAMSRNAD